MTKLHEDIIAKLRRWWLPPEYRELWVVYDGTDVSVVESLESTRHRCLCQVKELSSIVGQQAMMSVPEFLTQTTHQTASIHLN
jgi:hypothetical protein